MALTIEQLKQQLQAGQHAPVYLVHGSDQFLTDKARRLFVNLIEPDDRTLNLASFDMREVSLAEALDDAQSVPFFGDLRVVLLDNAYFLTAENQRGKVEHNVDALLDYLKATAEQTILVIFAPYDKLDARKKVVKQLKELPGYLAFGDLTEQGLRSMVQQKLTSQGYQIEPAALGDLIRLTNMSLTQIMTELDKLMLYTIDGKMIDQAAVEALVTKTLTENIFDLIENLLQGKLTDAVRLYHELLVNGEEPLRLHGALVSQFRLLLQVKGMTLSEQGIATALKVHPYRVKLAKRTVRRFTFEALAKAYLGLVKMETQLKSTQRDPELLFELFILRYQHDVA